MRRCEPGLIDLGEIGAYSYEVGDRSSQRSRRTVNAAIVSLLCLLVLSAAEPGSPMLVQLWSGQVSLAGFTVGPSVVTLSDPGATAIVGRDLWTGDRRWRLDLPTPPEYTTDTGDGTSAVVVMSRDAGTGDLTMTTTLVDPSGRPLVKVPGYQLDPVESNGLLLVVAGLPTTGCAGEAEPCSDVPALDRATGRLVWRQLMPGSLVRTARSPRAAGNPGRPGESFATLRRDGQIDIRDLRTGALLDSVVPPGGAPSDVLLFDDVLVTAARGQFGAQLTAYRLAAGGLSPLRPVWSMTVAVSDVVTDDTARFYLAGCGEFVCLHADGANAVIEPTTGRLRGQVGVEVVGQVGDTLLAIPSTEHRGTAGSEVYLLDATDGQRVALLADSVLVRWRDNDGEALVAQQGAQRTAFTIWNAQRRARPLGSVSGTGLTCEARSAALVCADPDGTLRAWRLPT